MFFVSTVNVYTVDILREYVCLGFFFNLGPKEQYYLLSDVLPEDKSLRNFFQKKTLVGLFY